MAYIMSIKDILQLNLDIPSFQRPYKWQNRNVIELLEDIYIAIQESKKYDAYKYRIGTIILFDNVKKDTKDVIDGQQRLFSLAMISYYLNTKFTCSLLDMNCSNKITRFNLHQNYKCIKNWFNFKNDFLKEDFRYALEKVLEVVVITVDKLSSAFQLFDSQNTRGKALDPHDLLKAYHLREMKNDPYEMYHAVGKWESFQPNDISNLFDVFLFPILNWARREKTQKFSTKQIDYYKGISDISSYTYAKRARKANPYFQITEPFISGNDFFEMVAHYLVLLEDIEREIDKNEAFDKIKKIINSDNSVGFNYTVDLFKCVLLCYYDKFHNFDEQAVKKLFIWAFMLRVDMENLGFDSINKYASGDFNYDKYTNNIPMFSLIVNSRFHTDVSNLLINVTRENNHARANKWDKLYKELKSMNGMEK